MKRTIFKCGDTVRIKSKGIVAYIVIDGAITVPCLSPKASSNYCCRYLENGEEKETRFNFSDLEYL